MSKERQLKILMERSPGIPLMLSVLADVGGVMAGILQVVAHYHHGGRGHLNQQDHQHHNWHDQMFHQVTWGNNKDRLRMLAEKFRILSPRSNTDLAAPMVLQLEIDTRQSLSLSSISCLAVAIYLRAVIKL